MIKNTNIFVALVLALGKVHVSLLAHSLLQSEHFHTCNYFSFSSQVAYGISAAATVRVGNELGAGRPEQAKRAACLCLIATS